MVRGKKWCEFCRMTTHNTNVCRKKPRGTAGSSSAKVCTEGAAKTSSEGEGHTYSFKISVDDGNDESEATPDGMTSSINAVLVDMGATTNIVTDRSKFVQFDDAFNPETHYIELANGKRTNNLAQGHGRARIKLVDSQGVVQEAFLEDALSVPSFNQDIFCVDRATAKGASVEFRREFRCA